MSIFGRNNPKVIFLMGPTASGKTALAIELRKVLPVELISVDSALVYKGMDIGTAKPNLDELRAAPHRLLNIIDPAQIYSVAEFRRDATVQIKEIISSGRIPLLVGGSMLYFKVLLTGLSPLPSSDPEVREKIYQQASEIGWCALYKRLGSIDPSASERIHLHDLQRLVRALEVFFISGKTLTELMQTSGDALAYKVYQFAIAPANDELLYDRIKKRFYQMLASGFETEVGVLFSRGDLHIGMPSVRCVGYRQMWLYLEGKISYNEMIHRSLSATRKLAKRQASWLRNWNNVCWLDSQKPKEALNRILRVVGDIAN